MLAQPAGGVVWLWVGPSRAPWRCALVARRLAHSLPDGTFSTTDAVARSFVGSQADLSVP